MSGKPEVAIIGAGYVGLTLALHMASSGLRVLVVDREEEKISKLRMGKATIFEKKMEKTLRGCLDSRRLEFSTTTSEGVPSWVIATPYVHDSKEDFTGVLDLVKGRGDKPPLIVIRTTVPSGYIRTRVLPELERRFKGELDRDFYLSSAPERTICGSALEELRSLPQLVGGSSKSVGKTIRLFERSGTPCKPLSSLEAAELSKLFSNFARFVQINLSNYFGVLCHQYGISEEVLINAIKESYPRLSFLCSPGPGAGGFCLPKDSLILQEGIKGMESTHFLRNLCNYPLYQYQLNEDVIQYHLHEVKEFIKDSKRVLAIGMAFKGIPQTDDTRSSVGVFIVRGLIQSGREVYVYDRSVSADKLRALQLPLASNPLDLSGFDALLLLNNDPGYRGILASAISTGTKKTIALYDPWRLLLKGGESVFQRAFSCKDLRDRLQ